MNSHKILCFLIFLILEQAKAQQRNIVLIMADDLGFNDVSYRGSNEIPTPNIDALAYNGVILNRFYAPSLCTPSRASLMTGKFPLRTGMQNGVIQNQQPWGLSLDEKLLPQYLKEAGYVTHLVGKWHLGLFQEAYTPTKRGYDTHYGALGGAVDHFTHEWDPFGTNISRGLDFWRNLEPSTCDYGQYSADLFTYEAINIINLHDPSKPLFLQVNHLVPHSGNDDHPLKGKKEDIEKLSHITDENRKLYASMVVALDDSVGFIVEALSNANLLDNTLIIFYSDNGGPSALQWIRPNFASNYPLRGLKGYPWEGGIRVPAIVFAPWLPKGVVRESFMHVCDILPTLLSLAETQVQVSAAIDGMDLSRMIINSTGELRTEIIQLEDTRFLGSLISNGYKLVNGSVAVPDGDPNIWWGTNNNNLYNNAQYIPNVQASKVAQALSKYSSPLSSTTITNIRSSLKVKCVGYKTTCNIFSAPCLFDIISDPCEEVNLASSLPSIYSSLKTKYQEYVSSAAPARNQPNDYDSDPSNFNFIWKPWK